MVNLAGNASFDFLQEDLRGNSDSIENSAGIVPFISKPAHPTRVVGLTSIHFVAFIGHRYVSADIRHHLILKNENCKINRFSSPISFYFALIASKFAKAGDE